jgi:hypothetical protein
MAPDALSGECLAREWTATPMEVRMTNVQERVPAESLMLSPTLQNNFGTPIMQRPRSLCLSSRTGDCIRRTGPQFPQVPVDIPPGSGNSSFNSGLMSIISQLMSVVQQLMSMIGLGGSAFGNTQGPEQLFQNANAASTGDPHLSFSGTNGSGATQQSHFDSMVGHSDLLDSDSFTGGYQISTNVTQPGANGVDYNQQATVSTNFGQTQVSLDNAGNATILQNGQAASLAPGQSAALGNAETVTRNADGSVVIADDNGMGGTISTTLRGNGQGVDVTSQASGVDLGGDLVDYQAQNYPPMPLWPF